SNFGKVGKKQTQGAIARSLLHLVAETIATTASLASEKTNCADLVFVGRVAQNPFIQERLRFTADVFGKDCFFPKKGEYATAIGAALMAYK
ncbi:MAG TPA: hypothetical protein VI874_02815, partial [Candidatus Norongarragalinales archaeon]|nr:hypothetical protein [Candidatus Norongarragalinales archaeon]